MQQKHRPSVQRRKRNVKTSSKGHVRSTSASRLKRSTSRGDLKVEDLVMARPKSHDPRSLLLPSCIDESGMINSVSIYPSLDAEEINGHDVDALPNHSKKKQDPINKKLSKITDIDLVDEQELRAALTKLTPKHKKEQQALVEKYKTSYWKWYFQLKCGFGLLMYGFGSKRALLEDFASSTLVDGAAVVVNGYLPTVNIKQVVCTIADALWKQQAGDQKQVMRLEGGKESQSAQSQSLEELLNFITNHKETDIVYVLVHNIDGPGLRDEETQHVLAKIAALKVVRFLASIDNVNAAILWDKQMSNICFNWWWHHTPTFASYDIEGTFLPLILAPNGSTRGIRSAAIVLQSLTPNAQSVFRTLASHQLSHPADLGLNQYQLYKLCREGFLVSSELTLRAHITEFKDHQLVCSRRGLDGQDCLYIPLQTEALSKLLEDLGI